MSEKAYDPTTKAFRIRREDIRELAPGFGACYASDRILVDGARVGFMYREVPDFDVDSGWRFLAGDESDEYLANPENFAIYDINTVANYDGAIIPLLAAPPGSEFALDPESGALVAVE